MATTSVTLHYVTGTTAVYHLRATSAQQSRIYLRSFVRVRQIALDPPPLRAFIEMNIIYALALHLLRSTVRIQLHNPG